MNAISFLLAVDILGIPILLICIALVKLFPKVDDSGIRYVNALLVMNIVYLFASIWDCLLIGKPGLVNHFILTVGNYLQFIIPYTMGLCLLLFVMQEVSAIRHITFSTTWAYVLVGTDLFLLAVNLFNHMYFYLDEQNNYHNGNYYWLSQMVGFIILVAAFVLIYENQKILPGWNKYAWYAYTVMPVVMLVVNITVPNLAEQTNTFSLFSLACSLGLIVAVIHDWGVIYEQKIRELRQMKAYMAFLKKRPHFVYNSLSTISQMTGKTSPSVSALVDSFSEFLRKNINDLAADDFARFSEELKHLENYLRLEKARFGPDLHVKVNVETGDFLLPRLVLAQLVETMVEFDFANSEDDCILILTVREDEQGLWISLKDKTINLMPDKDAQIKLNEELINIEKKLQTYPGAFWQLNGDEIHPSSICIYLPPEAKLFTHP